MMPMLVENRTTIPANRKNALNQPPIWLPRTWASVLMNSRSSPMLRLPTVDQTSTESMRRVKAPMQKKVMTCSRFATLHHPRQVDDGGQGGPQRRGDDHYGGDYWDASETEEVGEQGGPAGGPAGEGVGQDGAQHEEYPPRLPHAREAGDRRLAGGQSVALYLHVHHELNKEPDQREPQERYAYLRGDVRPDYELAGPEGRGEDYHARPEELAQRHGLGQVPGPYRRQYSGRDVPSFLGVRGGNPGGVPPGVRGRPIGLGVAVVQVLVPLGPSLGAGALSLFA